MPTRTGPAKPCLAPRSTHSQPRAKSRLSPDPEHSLAQVFPSPRSTCPSGH